MTQSCPSRGQRRGMPPAGTPPKPPVRKLPVPLATVAAILVVALLGGVIVTLGQNRARLGGETATTTTSPEVTGTPATATPTQTSLKLPLTAGTPVTNQPGVPVVAPSDPQVIYEYADNGAGVVLQRSEDGGASWTQLPYPTLGGFVGAIDLAVNPADAHNAFLLASIVDGPYPNAAGECPSGTTGGASAQLPLGGSQPSKLGYNFPASGGYSCNNLYASEDGGSHWSQVHLLVAGTLFQTGITFSYDATGFQAQGGTLYGRAWQLNSASSFSQTGDIRIVRSDDKGQTWSDADATLQSQVGHICAYAATPQGTTVFAVASTAMCWNGVQGAYSLWRSDDGGSHWSHAADLPASVAQLGVVLTAAGGGGSPALVYAWSESSGIIDSTQVQASADGGQTWSAAPNDGLPQGARLLRVSQTPLADGSPVAVVSTSTTPPNGQVSIGTVAVYAWKLGDATWRSVTTGTTLSEASIANVYVSTVQPLVVTLSLLDDQSSDPTYTLVPFA